MEIILGLLIILISAALQGMTSFGASLIAMPLLLLFFDIKVVVPLLISINLVMNIIIFRSIYKYQNIKQILPMLITALLFTIIGIRYLKDIDSSYIEFVIGAILVLLSIIKLFGIKFDFKDSKLVYIPVGMISGILNGIAGLSGPPVLIFLSAKDVDKNAFRATLTTYFLVLNIFTVASLIISKNYTFEVFNKLLIFLPALLLGLLMGIYLGNKVDEKVFKKFVLIFLGLMGIYMIYKSFQ